MELNSLLNLAINSHASDIHLSPAYFPLLRIDGELVALTEENKLTSQVIEAFVTSLMSPEQLQIFKQVFELDFSLSFNELASFRVNAFHQQHGIAAAFRVIPHHLPSLEELGAPTLMKQLLETDCGLILITGQTGNGKTTTLNAMLRHINQTQAKHIVTIEDPIEYTHQNIKSLITQRQVYRDTLGFSQALRAALREDPDIIVIGEIRDLETIRLALTAAETGHLVFATLHTRSAPRAIRRLIDVFPAEEKNIIRNLLADSLQAVFYQALVKCKTGGRIAAFETLIALPAIRHLIREDKIHQMHSIMQTNAQKGMCLMEQSLAALVNSGLVDPKAIQQKTNQVALFSGF